MLLFVDSRVFTFVYPVLLIGSVIAGFIAARHFYYNRNITWKASGIENGIIGLFGLLLSFTLLMSGNIQKDRTLIVHQLADAMAHMKRTSDLFPTNSREAITKYLQEHIDIHLEFFEEKFNEPKRLINDLNTLHENFWRNFRLQHDSLRVKQDMVMLPVYNQLNSASYKLAYSYMERVPGVIIFLIIVSSCLIGFLVGFMNGFSDKKHYLVPLIYIIIVTMMVQAIRDLDNPYAGTVRPKYDNLKDFRKSL